MLIANNPIQIIKQTKEHYDTLLDIQHPRQLVLKSEPLTFVNQRRFQVNRKFSGMFSTEAIQHCSHKYVAYFVTLNTSCAANHMVSKS